MNIVILQMNSLLNLPDYTLICEVGLTLHIIILLYTVMVTELFPVSVISPSCLFHMTLGFSGKAFL